jgi:hypothetical protein
MTRCAIIVEITNKYAEGNPNNGLHRAAYSHHCDGYLGGIGFELVKIVDTVCGKAHNLSRHDEYVYRNSLELEYAFKAELNQEYSYLNPDNLPGDIEYLYVVNFDEGVRITAYCRPSISCKDEPWEWPSLEILRFAIFELRGKQHYIFDHITMPARHTRELIARGAFQQLLEPAQAPKALPKAS